MRAFYRIRRSDWPLTIDGETSKVGAIGIGGTQALLIVHSSIYPNPDLEALTASMFLGNTYAEMLESPQATATQKARVFETDYTDGVDAGGNPIRGRSKSANVPGSATVIRANLIPHSWGGHESQTEQSAVDALP